MKQSIKDKIIALFPHLYLYRYNKKIDKKLYEISKLKHTPSSEYPIILSNIYEHKVGRGLNLNNPRYFTEKIQWLKLYNSTEQKASWTDKIKAKKLAAEIIGNNHIIPMVGGPYKSFDEIDFDDLPDQFVLKTNHGSGTWYIVKNKRKFLHSYEKMIAKARFDGWMQMDYGYDDGFELHYSLIKPYIFAEKFIDSTVDGGMLEYRFYCFNGKPCYVDKQRRGENHIYYRDFYDVNWNKIDVVFGVGHCKQTATEEKPDDLDEMIEYATLLSEGFPFVRVDLNHLTDKILFGELTFTGSSGFIKIEPEDFDLQLGSLLELPKER